MPAWIAENQGAYHHILTEIEKNGPLPSQAFTNYRKIGWHSTGWTSGRNVNQMLDYLWSQGKIMVSGRKGLQRLWDLSERHLPGWTPREELEREVVSIGRRSGRCGRWVWGRPCTSSDTTSPQPLPQPAGCDEKVGGR